MEQLQLIPFPAASDFPDKGPRHVLPWVWAMFLGAVQHRDRTITRWQHAEKRSNYRAFLTHEIKRAEVEIGLWLGRMKETSHDGE